MSEKARRETKFLAASDKGCLAGKKSLNFAAMSGKGETPKNAEQKEKPVLKACRLRL